MPLFQPIPGETPIDDVSQLKVKGIVYRSELNRIEAVNIGKALARYLGGVLSAKDAPFDFTWFCRLHREMFEDVWAWAGQLRKSNTNIGVHPRFIEQRLYDLCLSIPYWHKEPILMQAAMLHHQAVQIHPFENGNGRWSRALADIWLHLHSHPTIQWPAQSLVETSPVRNEYLESLKKADDGDYGPLLDLHRRFGGPTTATE